MKKSGTIFSRTTRAILTTLCGGALALSLSGCSPSALFGNGGDKGIQNQRSYRRVNASCSQMDLSSSRLDVPSAKQLVACLDADGALGDFAKLVKSMSKEELAPFVESLNRSFLGSAGNLYQLERILGDLRNRGELDAVFASLGTLLEEDELIARSVAIFRKSYLLRDGKIEPALLVAAERLAREITPTHSAQAIDLGLIMAESRALQSAWSRLKSGGALNPAVAQGLVAYGNSNSRIGRELVDHVLDGTLFDFVDAVVPGDALGIRTQTPRWASVLDNSLRDSGQIAGRLGDLFGVLSKPISCMKGARALRYAPADVIGELAALPSAQARAFIARDKLTQLYMAYPLCSFPPQAATGYQALVQLADTPAIEPLADLLRSANQINRGTAKPVVDYLVRAFGDPEFQQLLPALSEIQSRGAWQDALLLATLPKIVDRSQITYALQTLVEPLPNLGGTTIFDVLVRGLTRVDAADLTAWLSSFHETRSGLASALRGIRTGFYVNDAHPLLDLASQAMAAATRDPALLEAMLKVSARAEFQGSLRELSAMAADGRLRDLLNTTTVLFDRYAAHAQVLVHSLPAGASEPGRIYSARHDLAASDLSSWSLAEPLADFGACQKIDFSVRWTDTASTQFESQLQAVTACIGSDGTYAQLANELRMLANERTEATPTQPSRSVHSLLVEAYNAFEFTSSEARILSDWLLGAVNDGRVTSALKALPILVHESVIRPLVDFAPPLVQDLAARTGLRRLGVYGSSVLRREDFQRTFAFIDDLFRQHPAAAKPLARAPYDRGRLARWVSNKECSSLPSDPAALEAAKNNRVSMIIDEYEHSVIASGPLVNGKLRQAWTTPELKAELAPIFKKFADIPGNGPLARALTGFAARFGDASQYPPGYLEQWLRKRSNDRRITSYFYPGEAQPRVRLLNGLDRLSVVLLNSDLDAGDPIGNFGMQFLGIIADAWGDVPFEKRPPQIQAKYPQSGPHAKHCETLAEAINDINTAASGLIQMVGLPAIPQCHQLADANDPADVQKAETSDPTRPAPSDDNPYLPEPDPGTPEAQQRFSLETNLFNVAETVSTLQENLDDGGLRVLRDLFFDLYYTGPSSHQDPNAGLKNNLSVATHLVRAGLLRQLGQLMADTPDNDPAIHAFFRALIEGSSAKEIGPVAESIFGAQPDQDLLWNVIDQFITLKDPADIALAKSVGLNSLAAIDSLGHARSQTSTNELMSPLLRSLLPILAQHSPLLSRHTDLLTDFVTWQDGADFLRALAKNRSAARINVLDLALDAASDTQRGLDFMSMLASLDASPKAHQAWTDFRTRWKGLDQLPEYRALGLSDIGRQALNALEGRASDGSPLPQDQVALARKLLLTVASVGERNDMELIDQLLSLAQRRPDDFYKLIESVSQLIENGEIPRLLELVQQKLGPAA